MSFCGKFLGRFKDDHCSSSGSSSEEERQKKSPQKKKSGGFFRKITVKKKTDEKETDPSLPPLLDADDEGGKGGEGGEKKHKAASTLQLAPYLIPVRVQIERDGNKVIQEFLKVTARKKRKDFTSPMVEAISDVSKIHTIELIRCHVNTYPLKLSEMFDLRVVKLTGNDLRIFDPKLGQVEYLEELHLDQGLLRAIEPKVFGPDRFANLTVLNLRKNQLVFLPLDFGLYLGKLEYLDLSFNEIVKLPEGIFNGTATKTLQVLIADHNQLKSVPESLGTLTSLRKLFLSFNLLTGLPSTIGKCMKLEKLRIVGNQVEYLPIGILSLWPKRGGHLEELLIERNPLKVPSITGFEMGGLDLAFQLLEEGYEDAKVEKAVQQGAALLQELEDDIIIDDKVVDIDVDDIDDVDIHQSMKGKMKRGFSIADENNFEVMMERLNSRSGKGMNSMMSSLGVKSSSSTTPGATTLGGKSAMLLRAKSANGGGLETIDEDQIMNKAKLKKMGTVDFLSIGNDTLKIDDQYDYYYGGLEHRIAEIRQTENSILLDKKKVGLEEMQRHAKELKAHHGEDDEMLENVDVDELLKADVSTFHGVIPVMDLDLYFYLLVYATKPLFPTCRLLFERFDVGNKGYWDRGDWETFVVKSPIALPDDKAKQMWDFLIKSSEILNKNSRGWSKTRDENDGKTKDLKSTPTGLASPKYAPLHANNGGQFRMMRRGLPSHETVVPTDTVDLFVFTACFHIHEIDDAAKSINILRTGKNLNLDFLDMDLAELKRRMGAKQSNDATPVLDFNDKKLGESLQNPLYAEGEAPHSNYLFIAGVDPLNPQQDASSEQAEQEKMTTRDQQVPPGSGRKLPSRPGSVAQTPRGSTPRGKDGGGTPRDGALAGEKDEAKKTKQLQAVKVFLNEHDYLSKQLTGTGDSDDDLTDVELNSSDLSDSSEELDESFDALEYFARVAEDFADEEDELASHAGQGADEADEHGRSPRTEYSGRSPRTPRAIGAKPPGMMGGTAHQGADGLLEVKNDDDLHRLMSAPIELVVPKQGALDGSGEGYNITQFLATTRNKKRKKKTVIKKMKVDGGPISGPKDKRFRTDVLPVRRSLRFVYRSVPHDDFVKVVNYILKSLRYIKTERQDANTFWHGDDPVFKNTLGTNIYCVRLLEQMGFVLLNGSYWVWPNIHLKDSSWGSKIIPNSCKGTNKDRLDDIILLFKHCQSVVQKKSEKHFNGFFK